MLRKVFTSMLVVGLVLTWANGVQAAIVVGNNSDVWPTSPELETYDPTGGTDLGVGLGGTRLVGQSFRVTQNVSLASVYFEVSSGGDGSWTYDVWLYEVDDTTLSGNIDPAVVTLLAQGLGLVAPAFNSTEEVLRLDFTTPVALTPRTGTQGYIVVFKSTNANFPLEFTLSRTIDSLPLVGGSPIHKGWAGIPPASSLAFALTAVPEPASLALAGMGAIVLLSSRQRR